MTARTVVALSWSLVTGLVGGWLMVSPWALGERTSGGWPPVVRTEFFSGLGLVALALACLLVVAVQVAAVLRSGPNSARSGCRRACRSVSSSTTGALKQGATNAAVCSTTFAYRCGFCHASPGR